MMTEISLNILDVVQNSIRASATRIEILAEADTRKNRLTMIVRDNGCGMNEEQLTRVEDPFFTTRSTRRVGLGIPFFKMAALGTGGAFHISSKVGKGTEVYAAFVLNHIDRMPLGDMNGTIETLIKFNPNIDFTYTYRYDDREFVLDTHAMREILGDIPLDTPEVSAYIHEYLEENKREVDGGAIL